MNGISYAKKTGQMKNTRLGIWTNGFLNLITILFLLFLIPACGKPGFYVSPDGSDHNPGTRSEPFLTIQRAQEAVRAELTRGTSGDITVWLADGTYYISSPLRFDANDSGRDDNAIIYKALKGGSPVISGGVEVSGWQHRGNGLWVAEIAPGITETGFRELFVDGERATRARHPNSDYLRVAEVGADRRTNFLFNTDDFPAPVNPQQVELVLIHDWSISRIPLAEIDYQQKRITAVDSIGAKVLHFFNLDNWEKNPRYYLENDPAFLDAPGEWFFDSHEGLLHLMLPGGGRSRTDGGYNSGDRTTPDGY